VPRKRRPHPLAQHPPPEPGRSTAAPPGRTSKSSQVNNTIVTVSHRLAGAGDVPGSPSGEGNRSGSVEIRSCPSTLDTVRQRAESVRTTMSATTAPPAAGRRQPIRRRPREGHLLRSTQENMRRVSAPRASRGSQAAVQRTPAQRTPVQQTPVPRTPAQRTPVHPTPVPPTPVQQTPVRQTPVRNTQQRPGRVPRIYRTVR
jgi:hypothetical protein